MKVDGRCHCGKISFEAEVNPARVHLCHCTDCQALTGTAYRVGVVVAVDAFKLTGEPKFYTKVADSGKQRLQAFCSDCGAPIYSAPEDRANVNLRLGLVTQRAMLPPQFQIFCKSALPWAADLSGVRKFDAMP